MQIEISSLNSACCSLVLDVGEELGVDQRVLVLLGVHRHHHAHGASGDNNQHDRDPDASLHAHEHSVVLHGGHVAGGICVRGTVAQHVLIDRVSYRQHKGV